MRTFRLPCVLILAAAALAGCDEPKPRGEAAKAKAGSTGEAATPPVRQVPVDPAGVPALPEWSKPLVGKTVPEAFPKTVKCIGNTDIVQKTYAGQPAGVQIHGWAWEPTRKARVARVLLADKDQRIVGAGESGVARPDVAAADVGVTIPDAGWNADAPVAAGTLDAYGVVADDTVCQLGRITF